MQPSPLEFMQENRIEERVSVESETILLFPPPPSQHQLFQPSIMLVLDQTLNPSFSHHLYFWKLVFNYYMESQQDYNLK